MTREQRAELKIRKEHAQKIKDQMTVQQLIDFVNTPYRELPEELQAGMTKWPQEFNFVRMHNPDVGPQRERFAARLIRYRTKYSLSVEEFATIANEFAKMYGTRVTKRDILNYENYNICPKIDKMTAISEAMGVSIDYFAGYGSCDRKSQNSMIESRNFGRLHISIPYRCEMEKRKGVRIEYPVKPDNFDPDTPAA